MIILFHDTVVTGISLVLAVVLVGHGVVAARGWEPFLYLVPATFVMAGATFYMCGLHRRVWSCVSTADCIAVAGASSWLAAALFVTAALNQLATELAPVILVQWSLSIVMLCATRLAYQAFGQAWLSAEASGAHADSEPVLLFGCGPLALLFLHAQRMAPGSGRRVVGIVDDSGRLDGRSLANVPVLGRTRDLDRILVDLSVHGLQPRRMIVTSDPDKLDHTTRGRLDALGARHDLEIDYLHHGALRAILPVPAAAPAVPDDLPLLSERLGRAMDIAISALALTTLSPLIGLIALAVLIDLGPPLLFRQVRPGRGMRPFVLYKFKTMRGPIDDRGVVLPDQERISRLGTFLRRTRLDELPQLVNVLVGDMSVIGPRPLLPRDLSPSGARRLRSGARPGITGWAQVSGGHHLTPAEKAALDAWYIGNRSLRLDLRILVLTLRTALLGERVNDHALVLAGLAPRRPATASSGTQDAAPIPERRVVVVNRFFHPDASATAQLSSDLVAALRRHELAVTVVTSRRCYHHDDARWPAADTYHGAEVRRVRSTHLRRYGLLGRALDDLTFHVAASIAVIRVVRAGDVVVAETDPPLIALPAWVVTRLRGGHLVNWVQDVFPEIVTTLGIGGLGGRIAERPLRALRNTCLRRAAANVVLCDRMATRLRSEGANPGRIRIIHNWADGERIRPLARDGNPLRAAWGLDDRFVFGHSGNLGRVHDLGSLIRLIDALAEEPDLAFLFIGGGGAPRRLRDGVVPRARNKVHLQPFQPAERLPQSLTLPDLHLITLRPDCEGLVMPSKLYGVLAAGRPTLFIGDPSGAVARILHDHDAGLVGAPEGIGALVEAVRDLRADPARLARLGANARRAYDQRLSREASLDAWIETLTDLAPRAATQPAPHLQPQAPAVSAE